MRPLLSIVALAASCAFPLAAQDPIPEDKDPVTTASGLKYSVLVAGGEGISPEPGDLVKVHYTGWLTDGKVFDSSRRRGEPAEFTLGQVIEGWNEGLQLMTPGARFKLTIPPGLGYGEQGSPPVIPGGATLVFDVELLGVTRGPRFRPPDPEHSKKTDDGLVYEVLEAGDGEAPGADEVVELDYAFWTDKGQLLETSMPSGRAAKGSPSSFQLKFMQRAPAMMKPGARVVFRVPPELTWGDRAMGPALPANSTTVWELVLRRVIRPLPVPEFHLPDDADLKATGSGLRYQVIREGEGDSPAMGDPVKVHYAGWLTDGTLFDSSYSRGEPSEFRLGMVIEGWNEGLKLMKPGAIYVLVIPADLAYGKRGAPPKIGPDATLVFRVELVELPR